MQNVNTLKWFIRKTVVVGMSVMGTFVVSPWVYGQTQSGAGNPPMILAKNPMVTLINEAQVPAQTDGVLAKILVEEGSMVEEGQMLAMMDDRESRVTLTLKQAEEKEAEINASNDINHRYAINSEELTSEKANAYKELLKRGAIPRWEVRTAELEAFRDGLQIELAVLNQAIAEAQFSAKKSERELAELAVTKKAITAPFSGFIEMRVAKLGEWVQAGAPIVKLIQMDKLRVQGFVEDTRNGIQVAQGMPVVVEFELQPGVLEKVSGKLGFVGNDVDLSGGRRVWMEFENQRVGNDWKIRPGMKPARMAIVPQ